MATVYGVNAVKAQSENGAIKVQSGEAVGRVRSVYDEYTFPAAAFASGDVIEIGSKLPAGARVVDAQVKCPSLGTTGIFTLGYAANGLDVADPDAFLTADAGGQAVLAKPSLSSAGILKKFEAETQLILTSTEVTTAAAGLKIQVEVEFVLD